MTNDEINERLAAAGRVELLRLTEEEIAAVDGDRGTALQASTPPEWMAALSPEAHTIALRTALRGLIARGWVAAPTDEQLDQAEEGTRMTLTPLGELDVVLSIRQAPRSVAVVKRGSAITVLHGFATDATEGVLEERLGGMGMRAYVLHATDDAIESLAAQAWPEAPAAGRSPVVTVQAGDVAAPAAEGTAVETWVETYHSRPEGNRRTSWRIVPGQDTASVTASSFGVGPEPPASYTVNAAGLRRCVRAMLADERPA